MKKRTITISLIVFAIALLFGIGYASWTIARSDSGVASGNFTAYSVTDNGALAVETTDGVVKFAKSNSTIASPWLSFEGDDRQDLTAEFTVSWSGGEEDFTLIHSFFTGTLGGNDEHEEHPSPLLIGGPTFSIKTPVDGVDLNGTTLSFDDTYTAYDEVTIVVTYKFGTLFNESNPYDFFNGKGVNDAAFENGNYKGYTTQTIDLTSINTALSSNLNASASYADVANVALTALNALVGNGTLQFKVVVQKA